MGYTKKGDKDEWKGQLKLFCYQEANSYKKIFF